jgi:hypothetical protein
VDENTANLTFRVGDLIVLDTSENNAKDLLPFWDQIVLVDVPTDAERNVDPHFTWGAWPGGLSMGRLRCKRFRTPAIPLRAVSGLWFWVATIGPFSDFESTWEPGDAGIYVGHWRAPTVGDSIEEIRASEVEAEKQAPSKVRLEDAVRFLGRVVGWLRPPQRAEKEGK